jgi:hypothetical protein
MLITHGCIALALLPLIAGGVLPLAEQGQPPAPETAQEIRAQDEPRSRAISEPGEFRTADELLTALEDADAGMVSLTAGIRYDRTAVIQSDRQVYFGRLYFVTGNRLQGEQTAGADQPLPGGPRAAERQGNRKFAIHFDTRVVDDVVRNDQSSFIFDGEWLVEKNERERLFIKRQVVPPGENFDPLRIGDGPMPLPIGQKREDILKRYTAQLVEPTAGLQPPADPLPEELEEANAQAAFVRGSYQIRLIPRPEIQDDEFREIRLWYVRGIDGHLLPRMARTIARTGDVSLVQLGVVQVQMQDGPVNPQAQVPAPLLDTTVPREGWHVQITDWRGQVRSDEPRGR